MVGLSQTAPDGRTIEILERIKSVFAAKGFDGASMQDLARAAGMSAGNFYRYFPSKHAIIEAMIARDLSDVEAEFADVMDSPDPRTALLATIDQHIRVHAQEDGPLWAEIEAAASRREEIAQISQRMETEIIRHLVRAIAVIAELSEGEAAARFSAHAELIVVIVKGAAIGGCGPAMHARSERSAEFHTLVMRTIEGVFDDILKLSKQKGAA